MAIIVNLDLMLVKRKMKSKVLAAKIGLSEQNLSLLKSGKVKGVRFSTLNKICEVLECQPGDILTFSNEAQCAQTEQEPLVCSPETEKSSVLT
jgi:putative transcriptional regulator